MKETVQMQRRVLRVVILVLMLSPGAESFIHLTERAWRLLPAVPVPGAVAIANVPSPPPLPWPVAGASTVNVSVASATIANGLWLGGGAAATNSVTLGW